MHQRAYTVGRLDGSHALRYSKGMSEHPWFCQTPQGNHGPFSTAQMIDMLRGGQLSPATSVWREGRANWVPAANVQEFAAAVQPQQAQPQQAQAQQAQQAQPANVPAAPTEDDYYDDIFVGLVRESWQRYRLYERATRVDEVLVGAVITSTLDNGFVLIDLASAGANHYLRFESLADGSRTMFRLEHRAEALQVAKVIGHEAGVTIGYGERVHDFGSVWKAIKQELKGGFITTPDPGVITVDGDLSSQYIYVEVGLIWDINNYLAEDDPYQVNYAKLTLDIGATVRALRKYLRGRLHSVPA